MAAKVEVIALITLNQYGLKAGQSGKIPADVVDDLSTLGHVAKKGAAAAAPAKPDPKPADKPPAGGGKPESV